MCPLTVLLIAFRFSVASSSVCPPDKNMIPGMAAGTTLHTHRDTHTHVAHVQTDSHACSCAWDGCCDNPAMSVYTCSNTHKATHVHHEQSLVCTHAGVSRATVGYCVNEPTAAHAYTKRIWWFARPQKTVQVVRGVDVCVCVCVCLTHLLSAVTVWCAMSSALLLGPV